MPEDHLIFQLVSPGDESAPYPADVFVSQFGALLKVLSGAAKNILGVHHEDIRYGIYKISANSPITAEIEPTFAPFARQIADVGELHHEILDGLNRITEGLEPPKFVDYGVLQNLRDFVKPFTGVGSNGFLAASNGDFQQTSLTHLLKLNLDRIQTKDRIEKGGVVKGVVEQMNIHGKKRVFTLYPERGAERVRCKFPTRMMMEARASMGCRVAVEGDVIFRWREKWPYAVKAQAMRILKDGRDLPKFGELWGIAPNATGSLASEDFVRSLRDGEI